MAGRGRRGRGGELRVFVALPVPEPLAGALGRLAARLGLARGAGPDAGRVAAPEALHVTLAFLGETPDAGLEEAHHALSALRGAPVRLRPAGLGTFGEDPPRSLHLRLVPEPGLMALQSRVERALRGAGLAPRSRRFVPHVTLARWPRREAAEARLEAALAAALAAGAGAAGGVPGGVPGGEGGPAGMAATVRAAGPQADLALPETTAAHFALIASHLRPGGAEYEPLALYPLTG